MTRVLSLLCATLFACSSTEEVDVPFVDDLVEARERNVDGAAYPADHLGGNPRGGTRRGDRIPNFAFQGYPDSSRAGGLRTISLSDYYDPEQKRGKVLHLMEAASWCSICDAQTREMAAAKEVVTAAGVVIVQAIMNGTRPNIGPTLLDVDKWMDRFPTWFTVVIDDRAKRVGSISEVDGVPWNALVDLRTMEILFAGVGRPVSYPSFAKAGAEWVDTHAPSY